MSKFCFWLKFVALILICAFNTFLFLSSCGISYQYEMAREQTRFRQQAPTMHSWVNSPFGKLKSYFFNVTNADDFMSGRDNRMKLQQVGPIVYNILGYMDVQERNESSMTFRKYGNKHVEFVPEESVSPDILNQTIVQPNIVLLGTASKFNEWDLYVRIAFNAITLNEPVFLTNTVYSFLWELSTPGLKALSGVVPFISSNCGTLFNALSEKEEVYTIKIGPQHGIENFFRIDALNGQQIIKQQYSRRHELNANASDRCPINVTGAFDNSLFPPFVQKDSKFEIVAPDSCRTLPLRFQREQDHSGFVGYRFGLLEEQVPSCLAKTYGIRLPQGIFDASKCVINEAPTVFSAPHFYGSSYNWSEHFEGLNPNAEEHDPFILLEPTTGIPITEKYCFQSNIPMPSDMTGFNRRLMRFRNMMLPTFWYAFEMDELPLLVKCLMRFNIYVTPVLQPVLMTLFVLCAIWSAIKAGLLLCGRGFGDVYRQLCRGGTSNVLLETTFPHSARRDVTQLDVAVK